MSLALTINGVTQTLGNTWPYKGFRLPTQTEGATTPIYGSLSVPAGGSVTFTRIKANNSGGDCARLTVAGKQIGEGWSSFTGTANTGSPLSLRIDYGAWGSVETPSGKQEAGAQWGRWIIEFIQGGVTQQVTFELGGLVVPASPTPCTLTYAAFQQRYVGTYGNSGALTPENPGGMGWDMQNGHDLWMQNQVFADMDIGVKRFYCWYPFGRTGEQPTHPQPSDIDFDNFLYAQEIWPTGSGFEKFWNRFDAAMQLAAARVGGPPQIMFYLGTTRSALSFHSRIEGGNPQDVVERFMKSVEPFLRWPFAHLCYDIPHSQENKLISIRSDTSRGGTHVIRTELAVFGYPGSDVFEIKEPDAEAPYNGEKFLQKQASVYVGNKQYETGFDYIGSNEVLESIGTMTFPTGSRLRMEHFQEPGQAMFALLDLTRKLLDLGGRTVHCEPRGPIDPITGQAVEYWSGRAGWNRIFVTPNYWISNPAFFKPADAWIASTMADADMADGGANFFSISGNGGLFLDEYIFAELLRRGQDVGSIPYYIRQAGQTLVDVHAAVNILLDTLSGGSEA